MKKLSVNINKIATLRNARGGDQPNVIDLARDIQAFGAQGITVHPRPDERHITYEDVTELPSVITTEFNVEGNPIPKFIDLVCKVKPTQVTLVPDAPDAITSNAGWDTVAHRSFLQEVIQEFKLNGIRTSIFLDPDVAQVEAAIATGTDRIELYTESYAEYFVKNPEKAIAPFVDAAKKAKEVGIGLNAGHDLSLENIQFFAQNIPGLLEVSIGHALICESLYYGLENVINQYISKLSNP
ncbi:MAG: Pyridoxine 5'-phosphate synthase [Flavobacteriales bacterium]|nr:MAG: pyridoxine 5'-phosphate synthase [Flavobacteriales bacterium]CAI8261051.1 MAG: Pyridoxine 5'-phosphate synthase [Flavobacteriales bacterium]|tara:strand:- start:1800 stop:2519 length:720 start_codon:yes stop_codon:yes gene_type:complete